MNVLSITKAREHPQTYTQPSIHSL